ncbi:MAG: zinc-binding dehydrogenase [Chlorobium sp.]
MTLIRAAVLTKTGNPIEIISGINAPKLSTGQILVKVAFSGVCHSQLMEARGKRGEDRFLPHMLGHEGSGTVLEIGSGVSKVKPGDYVILGWIKGDGLDVPGTKYICGDRVINAGGVTTFSDYTIVSENRCVKLPEGVPLDVAVLFGCAILTGAGIVMNRVRPEKGSTVAVFGLGGIGLSALMACRLFDCYHIIAVDVEDDKLELAREFGATHVINSTRLDPIAEILKITGGKGVDYSVEAAGHSKTIETAFHSVRKFGGLCVFASHPQAGAKIELDPYDLISGRRIEGSWGGSSCPDKDIPLLAGLYLEGKLPLEKLLSNRYSLCEINQALDDLEKRKIVSTATSKLIIHRFRLSSHLRHFLFSAVDNSSAVIFRPEPTAAAYFVATLL